MHVRIACTLSTEVVNDAANAAFAEKCDKPLEQGTRKAEIWSVCFQGGTFDRIKQRFGPLVVHASTPPLPSSHCTLYASILSRSSHCTRLHRRVPSCHTRYIYPQVLG